MDITESYGFSAPPEVVFDVMTDPARTLRWLPGAKVPRGAEGRPERLRLGSHEYEVSTSTPELRLDWWSVDMPAASGSAQVRDGPSGGSQLQVRVHVPRGDERRLRRLMADAVVKLRQDVSDNFNAG